MTDSEITAEVAHEALFEQWPELRSWLNASRDDLRFQRLLDQAAEEWRRGRRDELLWWGARFEQLEEYRQRQRDRLTSAQRGFYDACLDYKRRDEARRDEQRRREKELSDRLLRVQSVFLAHLSEQKTAGGDACTGILLALEALPKDILQPERPRVVEAEAALYSGVLRWAAVRPAVLQGHNGGVTSAASARTGRRW